MRESVNYTVYMTRRARSTITLSQHREINVDGTNSRTAASATDRITMLAADGRFGGSLRSRLMSSPAAEAGVGPMPRRLYFYPS